MPRMCEDGSIRRCCWVMNSQQRDCRNAAGADAQKPALAAERLHLPCKRHFSQGQTGAERGRDRGLGSPTAAKAGSIIAARNQPNMSS